MTGYNDDDKNTTDKNRFVNKGPPMEVRGQNQGELGNPIILS